MKLNTTKLILEYSTAFTLEAKNEIAQQLADSFNAAVTVLRAAQS